MKVEKSDNYSTDSNVSHKSGLKILQKKYGLEKESEWNRVYHKRGVRF